MAAKVSPNVEPATRRFLDAGNAAGGKPIWELDPKDARQVLSSVQAGEDVAKPPAAIEDRTVPGGPNGDVRIRIVRPQGASGELPVILYTHGGGWVLGGTDTHDRLIRELANGVGAAVVFVDYTQAPDAQYPTQLEEAWAVATWIAREGSANGLDASRIAVVGDSVGGNLATVVARYAKERGGPAIACQVLFYPVTDADLDTGSYREFAEGHFLTKAGMKWFWDNYLPDEGKRKGPDAAPLRASEDQLRGLPRTLLIVAENDVLRDEGEAYARKLAAAGVRVEAARFLGTMHDFVMLNPLAETPATRAALRLAIDTLREAIGEEERQGARPGAGREAGAGLAH